MTSEEVIADWLTRCILPYEAAVRARLRRAGLRPEEVDDVIQEAYARIAALEKFSHITNPRSYFFQMARNILWDQLRRSRIVRIDTYAELDFVKDEEPDAEHRINTRQELERLRNLVGDLPERCRQIFVMRKVDGLSQKEIGKLLGVTENTVETQVRRGLQILSEKWASVVTDPPTTTESRKVRSVRTRHNVPD